MRTIGLVGFLGISLAFLTVSCQNPVIQKSSDATLKSLTVNSGTLNPSFSSSTTNYTVVVPFTTSSIIITGTAFDSKATLSQNNGVSQNLNVGVNTIAINVTAENNTTKIDYIVSVTREQQLAGVNGSVKVENLDYPDSNCSFMMKIEWTGGSNQCGFGGSIVNKSGTFNFNSGSFSSSGTQTTAKLWIDSNKNYAIDSGELVSNTISFVYDGSNPLDLKAQPFNSWSAAE